MKIYSDKNDVTFVQTITSASTFVSSITGIIKNYILKAFPKRYFKYIYTDTSETFQEYNKTDLNNKYLHKIPYPSITITPQLSIDNPVGWAKSIHLSAPNFYIPRDLNRYFPKLLEDPDGKYKIFFSSEYITFNLKFRIVTDSFNQATEIAYFLRSRFDDQTFKYLSNQLIQVEMPKTFVNGIAKIENLFGTDGDPITDEEDLCKLDNKLAELGKRVKTILRKKNLNTGNNCYFFEEKTNLLTLFTDLDIPESVIRDNSVQGEYEIGFRVQVSSWWPNAFMMCVNRNKLHLIQDLIGTGTDIYDEKDTNFYTTNIASTIALDRKDTINFESSTGNVHVGHCIIHEVMNFSSDAPLETLNLAPLFKKDLLKVHAYAKDHNYDLTDLMQICVRSFSGTEMVIPNEQHTKTCYHINAHIDYDNLLVTFENPVDTDIVLDVFINRAMLDLMLDEAMNSHDPYFDERMICTLEVGVQDPTTGEIVNKKVKICGFNSDEEMQSREVDKAFRVYTMYGIGYIALTQEGSPHASDMKICLGKDAYGNDIIRCLELLEFKKRS